MTRIFTPRNPLLIAGFTAVAVAFAAGYLCGVAFGNVRPLTGTSVPEEESGVRSQGSGESRKPLLRQRVIGPDLKSIWRKQFAGMACAAVVVGRLSNLAHRQRGRGRVIGVVDLDAQLQLAREYPEPCLRSGPDGAFDDELVLMPCVVAEGSGEDPSSGLKSEVRSLKPMLRMYYAAHSGGHFPGAGTAIGLALSNDNGLTWRKHPAAVLTNTQDGGGASTPCVVRHGDRWRMFYTHIGPVDHLHPHTRYALSDDGVTWTQPPANVAIDRDPFCTSTRPCVWPVADGWLAVYSSIEGATETAPAKSYRLRWARSQDGLHFTDAGELLGPGPPGGFDSGMTAYPWFSQGLIFYSGNQFGAAGIGVVDFRERLSPTARRQTDH